MATKTYGGADIDYGDADFSYIGGSMADRWYVNDSADDNFNVANNHSTAEGGAGGAGVPGEADNSLLSNASSNTPCNITAAIDILSMKLRSAESGGTNDYSNTLTDGGFALQSIELAVNSTLTSIRPSGSRSSLSICVPEGAEADSCTSVSIC